MPALAGLRWRRATQERGYQGDNLAEFVATLGDWMRGHPGHQAFVAEVAGEVVGMAWLAVLDRVPTANKYARAVPFYERDGRGHDPVERAPCLARRRDPQVRMIGLVSAAMCPAGWRTSMRTNADASPLVRHSTMPIPSRGSSS
jgi:hypothetical protein